MKHRISLSVLSLCLLGLTGCELYMDGDQFESHYAVESYLIATDTLPEVRITRTIPLEEDFNRKKMAVEDANVEIRLLKADNSIAERYRYKHLKLGSYQPVDRELVKSQKKYELIVTFEDGDTVQATTTVPKAFEVTKEIPKQYVYREETPISFSTTPSQYPGRQTYYLFTAQSLDNSEDNLTPLYQQLVEEHNMWINSYFINSSEVHNEKKFNTDEQNDIVLTIPWSLIAFYGPNKLSAYAIDDNLYDYVRSNDDFTEGTTLSNGEIQNTRYGNITGGIGIFGSMAKVGHTVEIHKANKKTIRDPGKPL